ncbi:MULTISPECIES: single-stranded-DNA-specific exonuclease RecJ [Solibacillus]|uniref:Single-stranded-DNA-specific exonuclease RecJ n=1 Tax=Solibacillus merdavium TaxID=2762218 RepID=A0ABR8XJH9_9BACL|nr:single-stranded-DNA-specific exonuclease RecJ [Solibacillus merdavium]MBD8032086.1 single-stranded-DNA-specific exonuclease RecJ [Solibacillus merdavium]
MIQSQKVWEIEVQDEQLIKQLSAQLNISSIAAKILIARGCENPEQAASLLKIDESQYHDPYLMAGMEEAITRIEEALENGEKILVYGDYDADGITSTTVLLNALLDIGADVSFVIPDRFIHGYGPNEELFRKAHEDGVNLIITVDNGISGIEQVKLARELGMDVIITDHHEPGDVLPDANVIIHPRIPQGHYPFGELAGVGVAFKLAHALYGELPDHLFEYVAIGTIADLVPLVGENRYLVQRGLQALQQSANPWVKAICDASGANQREINEETVGFYFGPRLNAIGRLGSAEPGVHFLMSEDQLQANDLAKQLNDKNTERKKIVEEIANEAISMIENNDDLKQSLVLVVAGEGWNPGVVGIVASRLVEKYYRPTIVLSNNHEKGIAKGSARSIEGFHLYNELAKNRDILPHFGGHPMAAGMTLPIEHVEALRTRLNEQAKACLSEEQLVQRLQIDVPIDLSEITVDAIQEIRQLAPFGTEFPKPIFAIQNVKAKSLRKIGSAENHLKMELEDAYHSLDAIGFNKGYLHEEISYGIALSLVGDLQINEWQGNKKPQFMVQDVRIDEWQLYDYRGKSQTSNWVAKVNIEKTDFIAFTKQTKDHFEQAIPKEIIHLTDEVNPLTLRKNIVLLDLPGNFSLLEKLLHKVQIERIYAHFHTDQSAYMNGMPTRDHFKWYYGFLKKRPAFNLNEHIEKLSQHIGLNMEVIKFMTTVFFELGFVTIENGLTTVNENVPKQALSEAPSYKMRTQQIELEQKLVYATYSELKQWFNERLSS